MIQLIQDFSRFDFLPEATSWQRRIRAELRFLQTLSQASDGRYDPAIEQSLALLHSGMERDGVLSNQTAQAAEQPLLCAAEDAKSFEFLCVAHAHIDMNWMWGYHETVSVVIDTFRTMLQIMEEYPDFTFSQSQASVYQILEQYAPEMLDQVRRRVAEGRWESTASAWVENDKNMPSGESLARQILYTKQYLSGLLNISPDSLEIDFNPDTFGHSMNVPEISAAGGNRYYYHCRGRVDASMLNRWQAPSGAELIIYTEPFWYNSGIDTQLAEHAVKLTELTGSRTLLKVYGVGDHGGGPTRRDLNRLIEMNSWPVYPKFTFSTLSRYFHSVEARRESLPLLKGEINFLCDGCYTTQSRTKKGNRLGEEGLHDAELFEAMAAVKAGGEAHPEIMAEAWQKVLFNQFHDVLTGSGVAETREYAAGQHQQALGAVSARKRMAFSALSAAIDTSALDAGPDTPDSAGHGAGAGFSVLGDSSGRGMGKTRIYHLFNSCPRDRTQVTEFMVWDYEGDTARLGVFLPDGTCAETQFLEKGDYWGHTFAKIAASVSVPASGWATVLIKEKPVTPGCSFCNNMLTQHPETFVLENSLIRAEFSPATASLRSLINKQTGRELIPAGREGRFEVATEALRKAVTGWGSGMTGWFTGRQKQLEPLTVAEMRPLRTGSRRSQLEIEFDYRSSKLTVLVTLDADSSFLTYQVRCDWREFGSNQTGVPCLQFTLPAVCAGKDYLFDVPCGFVRREGQEMDMPANRFVCAQDSTDALMLISQDKYGYRPGNGRISLTLIRSAYDPDPTPEIGLHDIRFAVCPTAAGKSQSEYGALAEQYLRPFYALSGCRHSGSLPLTGSTVRLESEGMMLSCVKISEDRKALILRLYEAEGTARSYTLSCGFRPGSAVPADLLERPIPGSLRLDGNRISGEAGPYQVITLRLEL